MNASEEEYPVVEIELPLPTSKRAESRSRRRDRQKQILLALQKFDSRVVMAAIAMRRNQHHRQSRL